MRRNDRSTAQITELNLSDLGLSDLELAIGTNSFTFRPKLGRRGSQVVRQGSAKALCVGSIPTLASISNCECSKEIGSWESQWLTVWLTVLNSVHISPLCDRLVVTSE